MDLTERARDMVLNPGSTWTTIEQEATSPLQLFVPYLTTLALIPAVASFVAWTVLGFGSFGVTVRLPLASGLGLMVTQYGLSLVMIFAWGWLITQLAPTFGGQAHLINGLKLTVYASTPAMLAGIFGAMPGLGFLSLVGGIYALYLVYQGLPVLMKNPTERTPVYFGVAAVAGIVGSLLISMLSSVFLPSPLDAMSAAQSEQQTLPAPTAAPAKPPADTTVTIKSPDGEVKIMAESLQDMARRLEAMAAAQEKARSAQQQQPVTAPAGAASQAQ